MFYPNADFSIARSRNSDDYKAQQARSNQIADRLSQIADEIEDDNADLDALLQETRTLKTEQGTLCEQATQRRKMLENIAAGKEAGRTAHIFADSTGRTPEPPRRPIPRPGTPAPKTFRSTRPPPAAERTPSTA